MVTIIGTVHTVTIMARNTACLTMDKATDEAMPVANGDARAGGYNEEGPYQPVPLSSHIRDDQGLL